MAGAVARACTHVLGACLQACDIGLREALNWSALANSNESCR